MRQEHNSEMEKCPTCGEITEGIKVWWQSGTWYSGELSPDDESGKYCSEYCAEKASTFACQGEGCYNDYSWEDRRKLSETQNGILCPICRLTPCGICGIAQEDHDEDHEFEVPEWEENFSPEDVKVWDNEGKTFDRYTACYWDNSYVGMSDNPFHPMGFGQHDEQRGIYNTELQRDERGTYSHLGRLVGLDYLPEPCIKLVMQDLKGYVGAEAKDETID